MIRHDTVGFQMKPRSCKSVDAAQGSALSPCPGHAHISIVRDKPHLLGGEVEKCEPWRSIFRVGRMVQRTKYRGVGTTPPTRKTRSAALRRVFRPPLRGGGRLCACPSSPCGATASPRPAIHDAAASQMRVRGSRASARVDALMQPTVHTSERVKRRRRASRRWRCEHRHPAFGHRRWTLSLSAPQGEKAELEKHQAP
jgi:hypothetical protein